MSAGLEKHLTVDSWDRAIRGVAAVIWLARPLLSWFCRTAAAQMNDELKNRRTR